MKHLAMFGARLAAVALLLGACQATVTGAPPAGQASVGPEASPAAFVPERLTPEQVTARRQAGEAFVVVDVRSAEAYAVEHVEGAVHAAWADIAAGRASLPKDQPLLLYCT
ncbi:MAG: rhodanese-like domain-containing protein [Candidatus Sericytochromatia bacterium]|nr:rhodanese-like domain-containing protein [Candidatus Sericytochromatia bacterium]